MKTLEEALHEGPSTVKQLASKIGKSESRTREMIAEFANVEKSDKKPYTFWLPDDDVVDETEELGGEEPPKPTRKNSGKPKTSGNLNPQPAIDAAKKKVEEKGGTLEWAERKWNWTDSKGRTKEMTSAEFAEWRKTL